MFRCNYCGKHYDTRDRAVKCFYDHDIVYVPISRADLNLLAQFLITQETDLITDTLYKTIQVYFNGER